jgi:AcrR family transcriptional regulator
MPRAGGPAPAERDGGVRARLRESMLDLVCELGYRAVTVDAIRIRAGADEGEFERIFGSKESAFVQIFEEEYDRFVAAMRVGCEAEQGWRDGLRAAAYAGARWLRIILGRPAFASSRR